VAEENKAEAIIEVGIIGAEEAKAILENLERLVKKLDKNAEELDSMEVNPKIKADDKASTQINKIQSSLGKLVNKAYNITIGVKDKISGYLTGIKSKINSAFSLLASPMGFIGITAVSGGLGAMAKTSLDIAGNLEQVNIAFSTMLRSGEKAKKFLKEIEDFSIRTPFEMTDLLESSRKLLAYGFKETEILPILETVGNASAGLGLGAEGINRITLAIGQMRAKAKLSGEEMRQLAEAGVPAWRYISNALGVSTQEAMKLAERGLIPAEKGINAILRGMRGDFAGLIERQSRTLHGLLSTLRDFFNLKIFGAFGEGLRRGLLPLLTNVVDTLTNNKKKAQEIYSTFMRLGEIVGGWVVRAFNLFYQVVSYLGKSKNLEDFGKRLGEGINKGLDKVNEWLKGEGGAKLFETIKSLGVGLGKAWVNALKNAFFNGLKDLFSGNFLGAFLSFSLFNFLGGGKLLGGAGGIVKAIGIGKILSGLGAVIGTLGTKLFIPIKLGFDIFRIFKAKNKGEALKKIIGEWVGGLGGMKIGALIGSLILPGIGTGIGAFIGLVLGSLFGGKLINGLINLFKKINWVGIGMSILGGLKKLGMFMLYGIGYLIGLSIRGIVEWAKSWWKGLMGLKDLALKGLVFIFNKIREFFKNPLGSIVDIVKWLFDIGKRIFQGLVDGVIAGVKSLGKVGEFLWNLLGKGVEGVIEGGKIVVKGIEKGLGLNYENINKTDKKEITQKELKIKAFATGGVVDKPTLALIGEKGREYIIPERNIKSVEIKERTEKWKSYQEKKEIKNNINVNVSGINIEISKEMNDKEIAEKIGYQILFNIKRALENRA